MTEEGYARHRALTSYQNTFFEQELKRILIEDGYDLYILPNKALKHGYIENSELDRTIIPAQSVLNHINTIEYTDGILSDYILMSKRPHPIIIDWEGLNPCGLGDRN